MSLREVHGRINLPQEVIPAFLPTTGLIEHQRQALNEMPQTERIVLEGEIEEIQFREMPQEEGKGEAAFIVLLKDWIFIDTKR